MRPGIDVLEETIGSGALIQRQHTYLVRLKMWLNKGDAVKWEFPFMGRLDRARLEDGGTTLITDLCIHRADLINGLFYGIEGMRVGGTRRLRISPHLAYGEHGVPNIIPSNAVLVAEVHVMEERIAA